MSGIAFGLILASGLLVKGSLIFIPPMFLIYMVARRGPQAFSRAAIVATILGLTVPIAAYSSWATSRSGELVILATQGRDVLLDGHNEISLTSGQWSPEWKNDPGSFYSKALAADPDQGSAALVAKFYIDDPVRAPLMAARKIEALGKSGDPISRLAINGTLALFFFLVAMKALRETDAVVRYAILLGAFALVAWSGADTVVSLAGAALAGVAGLRSPSFRNHLRASWNDAGAAALFVVSLNFVLLTMASFANQRFLHPAYFVLLLMARAVRARRPRAPASRRVGRRG